MEGRSWFGRLLDGPGIFLLAVLVSAGAIAAAKATGPSGGQDSADVTAARDLPSTRACRAVRAGASGATCQTTTALLTIADGSKPLLLDPLQARVMKTETEAT